MLNLYNAPMQGSRRIAGFCVSWKAVHLADYPSNFYAGCIHIPLLSVIQESGVFESILNTG